LKNLKILLKKYNKKYTNLSMKLKIKKFKKYNKNKIPFFKTLQTKKIMYIKLESDKLIKIYKFSNL